MIYPKLKYFSLRDRPLELDFTQSENSFTGKVTHSLMAQVVDMQDKVIVDAIIKYALEQGCTDLFLIDEDFVKSAIKNEIIRRKAEEQK